MQRLLLPFLLALATLMSGCASNSFKTVEAAPAGLSLKNSKVYAYSFLDIRDNDLGASMVQEIGSQLITAMKKEGVTLKLLAFKDSEAGKNFAATGGSMSVPVRQTMLSNIDDDKAFGPDYWLVIFPSQMTLQGAWKIYNVRWDLISTKTGQPVWKSMSAGRHLTMWKNDEDPEERARAFVETAIEAFRANGLI